MSKKLADTLNCENPEKVKEEYRKLKQTDIEPDNFENWEEAYKDYKERVNKSDPNVDEDFR